jgi:alpha-tubulin suppressor-like RCC1 family protein
VLSVVAGFWHSIALRTDGSVVAWGDDSWGQIDVPVGLSNVVAIAAAGNHSLALTANGAVVAWGENFDADGDFVGQSEVPAGLNNVAAIAAGEYHSLAVKNDGSVVVWGDNSQSQCSPPSNLSGVVAVAGGGGHSLALKADGSVAAWGNSLNAQCDIPGLSNAVAIAAGDSHSVVLVDGLLPRPRLFSPARNNTRFSAIAQTVYRKNYALECNTNASPSNWTALPSVSGNGALKVLTDPAANAPHRFYRLRRY